jgi:hypothetical protein
VPGDVDVAQAVRVLRSEAERQRVIRKGGWLMLVAHLIDVHNLGAVVIFAHAATP